MTVRPIQQLTGTSEFNEVFFDDAVTDADLVVGEPGEGWKIAMGLLTFERGVSTLGQQIGFARELQASSTWRKPMAVTRIRTFAKRSPARGSDCA